MKKRIHVIFHAHIDPVWLWQWQAGLDECLATSRSVCDILESDPAPFFSQGEAWVYQQIEQCEPELFARIKKLVEAGRWEITGGWWTQPDCNFPSYNGLQHQIALGKEYFLEKFGRWTEVGFNADSFGHCIGIPKAMAEQGQKYYAFMRPQAQEKTLPARMFRWRGTEDGPEIIAARIGKSYGYRSLSEEILRESLVDIPEGMDCGACFCGAGDHGGGPTLDLIAQVKELASKMDDVEVRFSTMAQYFGDIASRKELLPTVTGDLQFHSIGCYSVMRQVKKEQMRADELLTHAETAVKEDPNPSPDFASQLKKHWQNTVFHQFHDTLGGTCIPSAYPYIVNQLCGAQGWAEEEIHKAMRRKMAHLPEDSFQRIVVYNPAKYDFDGWTELTPWMDLRSWQPHFVIVDENGKPMEYQLISPEAVITWGMRLHVRLFVKAGTMGVFRIVTDGSVKNPVIDPERFGFEGGAQCLGNFSGAAVSFYPQETIIGSWSLALPEPVLFEDKSDTWTHDIDRYGDAPCALPAWGMPVTTMSGPFMQEISQEGRIGDSRLLRKFRLHADSSEVEMTLRVNWQERMKILKMVMPVTAHGETRIDRVCGGSLVRPLDGCEHPIQGWTLIHLDENESLAIVSPDVFALDATPGRVRLTLLRSPQMANHCPHPGNTIDGRWADQGEHEFSFRFLAGENLSHEKLDAAASNMRNSLFTADLTKGMPPLGNR